MNTATPQSASSSRKPRDSGPAIPPVQTMSAPASRTSDFGGRNPALAALSPNIATLGEDFWAIAGSQTHPASCTFCSPSSILFGCGSAVLRLRVEASPRLAGLLHHFCLVFAPCLAVADSDRVPKPKTSGSAALPARVQSRWLCPAFGRLLLYPRLSTLPLRLPDSGRAPKGGAKSGQTRPKVAKERHRRRSTTTIFDLGLPGSGFTNRKIEIW